MKAIYLLYTFVLNLILILFLSLNLNLILVLSLVLVLVLYLAYLSLLLPLLAKTLFFSTESITFSAYAYQNFSSFLPPVCRCQLYASLYAHPYYSTNYCKNQ